MEFVLAVAALCQYDALPDARSHSRRATAPSPPIRGAPLAWAAMARRRGVAESGWKAVV